MKTLFQNRIFRICIEAFVSLLVLWPFPLWAQSIGTALALFVTEHVLRLKSNRQIKDTLASIDFQKLSRTINQNTKENNDATSTTTPRN